MELKLEEKSESLPTVPNQTHARDVLSFTTNDPANPHNWSSTRKAVVVLIGVTTVLNSTVGTSITSGAVTLIAKDFHVTNQEQLVLPTSIYIVGYVFGPLAFGPISETYGRKWTMVATFFVFTIFTMACALAPNWPALVIFRLIVGISASSPLTVVGGIYADLYANPVSRGRAMSIFLAATTFGPVMGPTISGYVALVTWRWVFWVALILAGASWIPLLLMPETFAPIILRDRARRIRKDNAKADVYAPIELEEKSIGHVVTVILTRAIRMFFTEPIVLACSLYMSFAYSIFFVFLQAFSIIFEGVYHFTAGEEGLAFIPIGIGAVIACGIYLYYDHLLQVAKQRHRPWSDSEEYRRLPLALLGGPLFVVSLFWIGWTASPHIPWIVPILAGLPFGIGFLLIFMALINYLVDAYEVYAASAIAASTCCRSVFGAVLPFAARPMYDTLGVAWACSLFGFLSAGMCVIPFAFIKYGDRIRANSKFCQQLAEEKRMRGDEADKKAEEELGTLRQQDDA